MDFKIQTEKQREFFRSGQTKQYEFRRTALQNLKSAINRNYDRIVAAISSDLHKSEFESYLTEINVVVEEINYMLKHLKRMIRPQRRSTPLLLFPSSSRIVKEPYGVVLVIAPWNYPFQLLMSPLVGAIAAGNCVALKPSPLSPATSAIMEKIICETFDSNYISIINGDNSLTGKLLAERFDYIFYTGGVAYGREVMRAASEHLTPVTLELGGKSPCIVDRDANIAVAARRIVWGKFLNCGQTCVAPDYILVHAKVAQQLTEALISEIKRQFGDDPRQSPDYPRIISEHHVERLRSMVAGNRVIYGGDSEVSDRYVAPTLVECTDLDGEIMREEIFGPLLPILEFSEIDWAVDFINDREKPLALYYFGESGAAARSILDRTSSGGACINDVIVHVANIDVPFGGVGNSGMGGYHGRYSFDTFSHHRSVVSTSTWINIAFKFAPYGGRVKLLKRLGRS